MAKLYLDDLFNGYSNSPSSITIVYPKFDGVNWGVLSGLMTGEPSFSAQNKWGPVINDISNLTDFTSIMGSDSLFSWISASTMCWKGTTPLSIGIEFYLINYKRGMGFKNKLKEFVSLASLSTDPDASAVTKDAKVRVHGGYMASVFEGNKSVFDNKEWKKIDSVESLSKIAGDVFAGADTQGTITVKFGNTMTIQKLLLTKVDVTKSAVEVADQNGNNIAPLYYRVGATFTGIKPLITKDVDKIFSYKF